MKQGKVWGTTEQLIVTPMIEIHRINILSNSHCSMHKHEFKYNLFYVLYGDIEVHVRKNDYDLVDITKLKEGEWTTVSPNEYHMFKTNRNATSVLEFYYLGSISKDIIRETVGGKN